MLATSVVATETTAPTTMMTAATATITVVETALFAALTLRFSAALALAFGTRTKLWTTIFTAVVATIATATTAATIILASTIAAAIAAFITTTFAGTFVLTRGRSDRGLLGRVAAEEALQPAKEAGFFGFGHGRRGRRLERAWLFAARARLFTALTGLLAPGFAGAKLVTRFLRLVITSQTIIGASRLIGIPSRTVLMARRPEIRTGIPTRISASFRLCRGTADFPALCRTRFFLRREYIEFGFGCDHPLRSGRMGFDSSRSRGESDLSDGGWGCRNSLFWRDGRGRWLDDGWRFNDSGGNGLGCERIFVFGLMGNDLDGGRLIGAGNGAFFCGGGWSGRTGALAARQA